MINRRRFLTITAAAVASPSVASAPIRWQGTALGAEVSLTFYADKVQGRQLLQEVKAMLRDIEAEFSLFDPSSALSRLNRAKTLKPSGRFLQLLEIADQMHRATNGLFDPSIQPLWSALAGGADVEAAGRAVGWSRVKFSPDQVRLEANQALTFNGIAQGFATDLIRTHLARAGLDHALINIGEFAAIGGPFRIGLADPEHGMMSVLQLTDRAVATSSPGAQRVGGQTHILHPKGHAQPLWSTVSVTADSAAVADAVSTAFCLMPEPEIARTIDHVDELLHVTLVRRDGIMRRL